MTIHRSIFAATLAAGLALAASADAQVKLRYAHVGVANAPQTQFADELAKAVKERTAGRVEGGAPERLCAGVISAMFAIQFVGLLATDNRYDQIDPISLSVDLLGLSGMTAIALFANRIWPLWTSAMQLLSCTSHLGREVSGKVEPLVYAVLKTGPTFVVLIILLLGTLLHWRRQRKFAQDPSWIASFRPPEWMPQSLRT